MADQWEKQSERGAQFWILFSAWVYRIFGRTLTLAIISPAILFYFLTGKPARRASRAYLTRAHKLGLIDKTPGYWSSLSHFMSFAGSLVDKLGAWTGKVSAKDVEGSDDPDFTAAKTSGKGGLILTAHIGNPELIRAVATVERRFAVTVLMHTRNAENYNNVLKKFSPTSRVNIVEVDSIDVTVAMELSAAVERGEWVVMAADRLPPREHKEQDSVAVDFLAEKADLPVGPYVLAAALKCPVYFLVCVRTARKQPFKIVFREFTEQVTLPRRNRLDAIRKLAQKYADLLTEVVHIAPYQWFNFYDYWGEFDDHAKTTKHSDTIQAENRTQS